MRVRGSQDSDLQGCENAWCLWEIRFGETGKAIRIWVQSISVVTAAWSRHRRGKVKGKYICSCSLTLTACSFQFGAQHLCGTVGP